MAHENTNWGQSVAGVVLVDGKVLLGRHTYGSGQGKLIIPGGYVDWGETPQQALVREFLEETGVQVEAQELLGVRFNMHDWYVVFRARYVAGEARSDRDENSEVIWMDVDEALNRDDVPGLTKSMIRCALQPHAGLEKTAYVSSEKHAPYSLYCNEQGKSND